MDNTTLICIRSFDNSHEISLKPIAVISRLQISFSAVVSSYPVNLTITPSESDILLCDSDAGRVALEHVRDTLWMYTLLNSSAYIPDNSSSSSISQTAHVIQNANNLLKLQQYWSPPDTVIESQKLPKLILNPPDAHSNDNNAAASYASKSDTKDMNVQEFVTSSYYKTLYESRLPLQYFAKSTLLKARNACSLSTRSQSALKKLAAVLKTLITPPKLIEQKYKTVIPLYVRSRTLPADTAIDQTELDRLYKWAETVSEQHSSAAISALKVRETQLQCLLVLELLHIGDDEPDDEQQLERSFAPVTLLESLMDRLSIWQEFDLDWSEDNADLVKSFFKEIIVPYYNPLIAGKIENILKRHGDYHSMPARNRMSSQSMHLRRSSSATVDLDSPHEKRETKETTTQPLATPLARQLSRQFSFSNKPISKMSRSNSQDGNFDSITSDSLSRSSSFSRDRSGSKSGPFRQASTSRAVKRSATTLVTATPTKDAYSKRRRSSIRTP
ncbi:hypothetical protein CANCADRAFT_43084 [Tortispora caseinolytica NRRL Y-17796]|uniref:DNA replication regulator Sld3 C-terminal domain-containing protein n=1 Tax=Tortispora caseinolytica NRRL Y-17796 TaxID=767744 RepID=A0A1E4TL50_9ASCO|nr:hypothetical protein CANCADRAFT_43084 [Tortispora caseinolytica NRRL Y-17796]